MQSTSKMTDIGTLLSGWPVSRAVVGAYVVAKALSHSIDPVAMLEAAEGPDSEDGVQLLNALIGQSHAVLSATDRAKRLRQLESGLSLSLRDRRHVDNARAKNALTELRAIEY